MVESPKIWIINAICITVVVLTIILCIQRADEGNQHLHRQALHVCEAIHDPAQRTLCIIHA